MLAVVQIKTLEDLVLIMKVFPRKRVFRNLRVHDDDDIADHERGRSVSRDEVMIRLRVNVELRRQKSVDEGS